MKLNAISLAAYRPFDETHRLNKKIYQAWEAPVSGIEIVQKTVKIALLIFLWLGGVALEALIALPVLTLHACFRQKPNFDHLIENTNGKSERIADEAILRDPFVFEIPEGDDIFLAHGLAYGLKEKSNVEKERYEKLLAYPEQAKEIDLFFWVAACAIAVYFNRLHSAGSPHLVKCPHFLQAYFQNKRNGTKSLKELSNNFIQIDDYRGNFGAWTGKERVKACVISKIINPLENYAMTDFTRQLVRDVFHLAHVIASTPDFRDNLYRKAVILHPSVQMWQPCYLVV